MVSRCCKDSFYVAGCGDFPFDKQMCTQYYACSKCHKPCDILSLSEMDEEQAINHG